MDRHPQRKTVLYVVSLVTAGLFTAIALIAAGYGLGTPVAVVALSVVAAVAERISVRFTVAQRGLTKTAE
ncbi:MAG: hypothetical protein ACRDNY_01180, partial [Gaiellaceae bacterium]